MTLQEFNLQSEALWGLYLLEARKHLKMQRLSERMAQSLKVQRAHRHWMDFVECREKEQLVQTFSRNV